MREAKSAREVHIHFWALSDSLFIIKTTTLGVTT